MEYKEKLRLAKEALDSGSYDKDTIEYIFPELKENDNTDIRTEIKNIITYFYGSTKLFIHLHSKEELLTWLERQCKQKPVDKVEPKFNEGYWERLGEKPVNGNLEKEVYEHLWKGRMGTDVSKPIYFSYDELLEVARHFAAWQKQKDESKVLTEEQCRKIRDDAFELGKDAMKQQMEAYRIEHCKSLTNEQAELEDNFVSSHIEKNNRIPTFIDAIEYGIEYGKQQMMAKAVDGVARPDDSEVWCDLKSFNFKDGDKVKVIVIKED